MMLMQRNLLVIAETNYVFGSVPLFRSQSQSQVLKNKLPFLFQKFHVVIPSLSTFSRNCRIYQVVFPPLYSFSPMHPTKNKSILKRIKHKCLSKGFYNFKLKMLNASSYCLLKQKGTHLKNHKLHIFRNKLTIAFESVRLKVAVFLL